tara:strand:+ start:3898 stop:4287 length:390 start_codon:yes stop_codon:yes gene_type:complete
MKKRIIQIIGLPASGKTTAISHYTNQHQDINHIDIKTFNGKAKIKNYKRAINKLNTDIIAESACGVNIRGSVIIHWNTPRDILYSRSLKRDQVLDEDYLSLLETQMLPAQYSVSDHLALEQLLDTLLRE